MSAWRLCYSIEGPDLRHQALAFKRGVFTPEPTDEDIGTGPFHSFFWGQRNLRRDVLSASGETPEIACLRLEELIRRVDPEATFEAAPR